MHIKSDELFHSTPEPAPHGEDSILLFIIVLMLLGMIGYLFVQYAIPVFSSVIYDFLSHSIETTGELYP